MNENGLLDYYNNILFMSKQILKNLGFQLVNEGFYDDEYYGDKYVYENIVIKRIYDDVSIDIDEDNVFYFSKSNNKITYEPGPWPKAIEIIYDHMSDFLREREEEKILNNKKVNAIKELEPYIEICSDIYEESESIYSYLKSRLDDYGINLDRVSDYYQTYSNIQVTYDNHYFYKFVVTYNGKKVFECEDVKSDLNIKIFRKRTMDEYLRTIKLGDWIPIFKEVVGSAKIKYNKRINEKVNEKAQESIKKLIKRFE